MTMLYNLFLMSKLCIAVKMLLFKIMTESTTCKSSSPPNFFLGSLLPLILPQEPSLRESCADEQLAVFSLSLSMLSYPLLVPLAPWTLRNPLAAGTLSLKVLLLSLPCPLLEPFACLGLVTVE